MRGMPQRLQPQCLTNESDFQIKIKSKIKNKTASEIKRRHRNNRDFHGERLKIMPVDRSRRAVFPLLLLLAGLNGLTQVGALKGKCQQMQDASTSRVAFAGLHCGISVLVWRAIWQTISSQSQGKSFAAAYELPPHVAALPIYLLASFVSIYVFLLVDSVFWLFLVATHAARPNNKVKLRHCGLFMPATFANGF